MVYVYTFTIFLKPYSCLCKYHMPVSNLCACRNHTEATEYDVLSLTMLCKSPIYWIQVLQC